MGIEGQYLPVEFFGTPEGSSFLNEPVEQRHHVFVLIEDKALRMPLYSQNRLIFGTFYGFDDAIGGNRRDLQSGGGLLDCLVVEGIDRYPCRIQDAGKQAVGSNLYVV